MYPVWCGATCEDCLAAAVGTRDNGCWPAEAFGKYERVRPDDARRGKHGSQAGDEGATVHYSTT
jgi:hypothetical protein